jgi:uncharacterized protein YjeT (DUF2065 family)
VLLSPISVTIALAIVLAAGLYLVVLGVTAWFAPGQARHFLLRVARSARAHYAEMAIRILVGGAMILAARRMPVHEVVWWFGLMLVVTSIGLLLVPWRWHRAFADRAIPQLTGYMGAVGTVSLLLGILLSFGAVHGMSGRGPT